MVILLEIIMAKDSDDDEANEHKKYNSSTQTSTRYILWTHYHLFKLDKRVILRIIKETQPISKTQTAWVHPTP